MKDLLLEAESEIQRLRRANEILSARVDTFQMCVSLVQAQLPPFYGQAMAEDVAGKLRAAVNKLERAEAQPFAQAQSGCAHRNVTVSEGSTAVGSASAGHCTNCGTPMIFDPLAGNWREQATGLASLRK